MNLSVQHFRSMLNIYENTIKIKYISSTSGELITFKYLKNVVVKVLCDLTLVETVFNIFDHGV